ncbi:MAG TPA: fused MFS/spermidine synthase [Terracidiphilus sp.]|nr:fused MFS/spermidine synthase [Terracidiphilus sp.]
MNKQPQSLPAAREREKLWPYFLLFFISGFPALTYQIVWQRALFTIYGVNIESVTIIVTVFMLGLGLGSLAGGRLSAAEGVRPLRAFGIIEVSIGTFGFCSLWIFHRVAEFTAGVSTAATGAITFLLLLVPTLLMGSTLPLLVAHLVRRTENVGESVGSLYSANTFGSAAACLLAALVLMRVLGESGCVRLAACLNLLVGTSALMIRSRSGADKDPGPEPISIAAEPHSTLRFKVAMLLAAATGFVALAYEIIWYRLYSFSSGGSAPSFANLLAYYLFGIAYGALVVHDACKKKLRNDLGRTLRAGAAVVAIGAIAAFAVGPILSGVARRIPYSYLYGLVTIAAALLGASFPILSHAAIGPEDQAGKKLSYLYLSNIVGSALGSFLVGFVILDHWSTSATSLLLLGLGMGIAAVLATLATPRPSKIAAASFAAAFLVLVVSRGVLFSDMYERLLWKELFHGGTKFTDLVENRSGVIAVDAQGTVYGGGVYDGHFNLDPMNDTNGIFRAYAIPGLHPDPREVLVIGLSSGSWAQILANDPQVEDETIVEINPGYLPLIRERRTVASLLQNPKVHIVIDDGRRWLAAHPGRKFDFILMNMTFNWRANASNLLSVDFLQIVREHLRAGGVAYYNTTGSGEVQLTGATVYPYALRLANFIAVSDSPIVFDRARLRSALEAYRIDGRQVFDLSRGEDRTRLDQIVSLPESTSQDPSVERDSVLEDRASLLRRLKGMRLITDDNMGTEWQ